MHGAAAEGLDTDLGAVLEGCAAVDGQGHSQDQDQASSRQAASNLGNALNGAQRAQLQDTSSRRGRWVCQGAMITLAPWLLTGWVCGDGVAH